MTKGFNRIHFGMKRFETGLATATLLCAGLCAVRSTAAPMNAPLNPVPVTAVRIADNFWAPRLEVYRANTIPHSWQYIEDNIKAMKKIAGLSDEACKTGRWTEANLYKYMETVTYSLAMHPDAELEKRLDEIISAVAAAQKPDTT
jgi:DUF1680 family protein